MKHLIKKILKEEIDKSLISRIGTNVSKLYGIESF